MKNKYIMNLEKKVFSETKMLKGYFEIENSSTQYDLNEKDTTMFFYFLDNKDQAAEYAGKTESRGLEILLSDIISNNIESLSVNYI